MDGSLVAAWPPYSLSCFATIPSECTYLLGYFDLCSGDCWGIDLCAWLVWGCPGSHGGHVHLSNGYHVNSLSTPIYLLTDALDDRFITMDFHQKPGQRLTLLELPVEVQILLLLACDIKALTTCRQARSFI